MIYALFGNAEHTAVMVTVWTNFASFFLSDMYFLFFFLIFNSKDQTVKNMMFPTDITRRWNFQAIKTQTEKEMNHCWALL